MAAPVPGLPGHEVVFSRDHKARKALLTRGVTALVFAGLAAAAAARLGPPMLVIAGLIALGAVGCGVAYVYEGTFRTVLRPDGIHVRRFVPRVIPWSDVAGFRVRRRGQVEALPSDPGSEHQDQSGHLEIRHLEVGWRNLPQWDRPPDEGRRPHLGRVTVEVVRANGHHVRLPAPVVSGEQGDYQFDDKVRQLEQWRRQYGSLTSPAL